MSFELKTRIIDEEEHEIIEETITKTEESRRIWSKDTLQDKIIDLTEEIIEIEARISVLTEQLARFTKK